ncbi:MAG: hypothetical protein ACRD0H_31850 [Actinomycetes bacterium]
MRVSVGSFAIGRRSLGGIAAIAIAAAAGFIAGEFAHSQSSGTASGPVGGWGRAIRSLAVSPDGHKLAAASQDGSVTLWDITDPAHPRRAGRL